MRRPKKESGASLDSLLDTMFNVVGILVILMTVTQLGVSDAVDRISATTSVTQEDVDDAQDKLDELKRLAARLRDRLKALMEEDDEDPAEKLARLQEEIEKFQKEVAGLEAVQREELELRQLQLEMQELLEQQKKEVQELLARRNKNAQELASLKAKLADLPEVVEIPRPKEITLPNPRPAPEGIQPKTVLCREGRVIYMDDEGIQKLQQLAQKKVLRIISQKRLGRDPAVGIDGKILAEEFNRDPPKDRYSPFDLKMEIAGRVPRLVLVRREGAGEDVDQLQRSISRYRKQIGRTDPNLYYLRFLVWPDSFEAYLEARKLATKRGLLAGWQAQTTQAEQKVNLGGDLRVGPPPPPPKPKPKPKPGDPPPPKPKPKPRPVPTDVID